ncbi:unnamed protein product, partial [Amoebophrya sp. A25]
MLYLKPISVKWKFQEANANVDNDIPRTPTSDIMAPETSTPPAEGGPEEIEEDFETEKQDKGEQSPRTSSNDAIKG